MIPLGIYGSAHYSSSWTPINLSGLSAWFDAADTSTITSSGGRVSQWDDKSGNGYHATQLTADLRPTTATRTQNGLNVIDFNLNELTCGNVLNAGDSIPSMWVVAKYDTLISGGTLAGKTYYGMKTGRWGLFLDVGDKFYAQFQIARSMPDGRYATYSGTNTTPSLFGMSSVRIPYAVNMRINGITVATSGSMPDNSSYISTFDPFRIGRYDSKYAPLDGWIAEIVVVMGTLANEEIAELESYLMIKWGL